MPTTPVSATTKVSYVSSSPIKANASTPLFTSTPTSARKPADSAVRNSVMSAYIQFSATTIALATVSGIPAYVTMKQTKNSGANFGEFWG